MLSFLCDKLAAFARRYESPERLRSLSEDEDGAIVLLCLAAVLILFLMSWLVYDGIIITNDKIEAQASADVGVYSQAGVKARSMNMLAFSNVAKRSIVGVHSVYESMIISYHEWTTARVEECLQEPPSPQCDYDVALANRDLFIREYENDYEAFQANHAYHLADVRALDNYQNYIVAITPWWGWSEAVTRAQRNGAILATSFPPPQGTLTGTLPDVMDNVINAAGAGVGFNALSNVDELPVRRGVFEHSMILEGMVDNQMWRDQEHLGVNVATHQARSSLGAASSAVIDRGASFDGGGTMEQGLQLTAAAMGEAAAAWQLRPYDLEANWLMATSNIVLTYHQNPEYFANMRDKYRVPHDDYEFDANSAAQQVYRPTGYWGMARAEISFQGEGPPDMWTPAWTARMRPVSLPGEFREAGYDFNALFHSSMAHLLLSGRIHENIVHDGSLYIDDLIYFERVARAMGQSTIEGVGR